MSVYVLHGAAFCYVFNACAGGCRFTLQKHNSTCAVLLKHQEHGYTVLMGARCVC